MPKKPGPKTIKLDPARVEAVAAMGGTNGQIAAGLGVSEGTLFNVRKRDPEVDAAITRGKDKADIQVIGALFRNAIGQVQVRQIDARGRARVITEGTKPDTTACIFWLKNRRPKEWRDRQQIDGNLTLSGKLSLVEFKKSMKDCGDAASRD